MAWDEMERTFCSVVTSRSGDDTEDDARPRRDEPG